MKYNKRAEKVNNNYRKIEAMYRKNVDTDAIVRAVGMTKIEVLDIMQRIFAFDMMKKEGII